jgi:hypothetical protein
MLLLATAFNQSYIVATADIATNMALLLLYFTAEIDQFSNSVSWPLGGGINTNSGQDSTTVVGSNSLWVDLITSGLHWGRRRTNEGPIDIGPI